MKNYLRSWNFMRLFRLALGVMIIIQGIQIHAWMYIILGVSFSLLPLFNIGCCATGNCNMTQQSNNKYSVEETTYDEVK